MTGKTRELERKNKYEKQKMKIFSKGKRKTENLF